MYRLPKSSNQLTGKRQSVSGHSKKNQGICNFPYRKCNLVSLDNYDYCIKHILEDKSAPYKPCPYLYTSSGKKCGKPAYRPEYKDTWFCSEHSRRTQVLRQRASCRHAPPQTSETLLASLSHYAQPTTSTTDHHYSEDISAGRQSAPDPFVEIDAGQVNTRNSQVLDYASESDSDVEGATLDTVWRSHDHESSDAESVDSQAEDPLKHAGVYTAEEVTVIIKDKMLRLQSLYIDQFRRLQHLLKERRRTYLHSLKKEKETMCSIHNQDKTTPREQKLYKKLKALNHFRKYYGEEAILHKKALERRAQVTEGNLPRTSHKGKCAFTEGGVKCGAKTLPGTKYCRKHILEDTQQLLFRACGFNRDDHTCREPTLNVFEDVTCVYHVTLPHMPPDMIIENELCDNNESRGVMDDLRLTPDNFTEYSKNESNATVPDSESTESACTSEFADSDVPVIDPLEPSLENDGTNLSKPLESCIEAAHLNLSTDGPLKHYFENAFSSLNSDDPLEPTIEAVQSSVNPENFLDPHLGAPEVEPNSVDPDVARLRSLQIVDTYNLLVPSLETEPTSIKTESTLESSLDLETLQASIKTENTLEKSLETDHTIIKTENIQQPSLETLHTGIEATTIPKQSVETEHTITDTEKILEPSLEIVNTSMKRETNVKQSIETGEIVLDTHKAEGHECVQLSVLPCNNEPQEPNDNAHRAKELPTGEVAVETAVPTQGDREPSEGVGNVVDSGTQNNPDNDLVMVDMMSDVGVVEEVLETEEKQEPHEHMDIEYNNLGNG